MKEYCAGKGPRDLLFPNGIGGVEYHFLRRCKNIAERAGLSNWDDFDLHRWRKTGATLTTKKVFLFGKFRRGSAMKVWR